jgi:protein SCO1/2
MKKTIEAIGLIILFIGFRNGFSADFDQKIGIVEKLGNKIPLDISFIDSEGKTIALRDLIKKPTVIDLAYYK